MSTQQATAGAVIVSDEQGIRRITLAHPPLNVLTTAMLHQIAQAVDSAAARPQTKVILLTGEGARAFCAGVDVAEHTPEHVGDMMHALARAVDALLSAEVPVVAALNGAALGGGFELALACDVVHAHEGVRVGQPEIRLGVFPPVAAALLPRLVGRQHALDLILSGRTLHAEDAHTLGLIGHVHPVDTFDAEVNAYAGTLASHSGAVLRLAKRAVADTAAVSVQEALREADRIYLEDLMSLHDAHEGLAAFLEKRTPAWRDA